jgi:hypothetical protein
MAFAHGFQNTRVTAPDLSALQATIRTALMDATVIVYPAIGDAYLAVKDGAAWSPADIATAQTAIDAAPAATPQSLAQGEIDRLPISWKAIALLIVDKLNDINGNLVALLAAVNALNAKAALPAVTLPNPTPQPTPAQAIAAIRTKAGTL